jgi:hypothetical protein
LGTLWLILSRQWWRNFRALLIGGGLSVLAVLPTVGRALFSDPQIVDQFRRVTGQGATVDFTALSQLVDIVMGRAWGYLSLGDKDVFSTQPLPVILAAVLLLVGLAISLRTLIRRVDTTGSALAELIILSLALPVLWLLRHTTPPLPHYQLVTLPAAALLIGAAVQAIPTRWRWIPTLAAMVLAGVWIMQLSQSLTLSSALITPKGLGTPLFINQTVASVPPSTAIPILFTHGDNPDLDGEAAIFSVLWWDRPHRIVNGENVLILPSTPSYLIATVAPFQAWEELDAADLTRSIQTFPRRGEELPFVAVMYDGQAIPSGFTDIEPIQYTDGLQLEGWKVRRVGPRMRISTLWRVMSLPKTGTYQQFHHLRTQSTLSGDPFKVSDVGLSASTWQVGDRLIVMGDFFPDSSDQFWVDIGHYTLSDMQRIPRADGQGDTVRIGPFSWK